MFHSDLGIKGYFHLQKLTFQRLGIDMTTRSASITDVYVLTLQIVALMTIILPMIVYSYQHLQEISEVTNALAPFMQATITLWKIWRVIYWRKDMAELVENIYLISEKAFLEATKKELSYLRVENNRERIVNTFYYYSVFNTGMLALTAPLLVSFIQYLRLGEFSYILVLKATYPIDFTRPLNFFLIWLWSAIAIYGVIYGSVSVDSLYSWYIHNLVGNLKILQSKIVAAELIADVSERRDSIYYCIDYHQRLIAMSDQLNTIYQPIVFIEFSLNAIQICFLAYQIGSGEVAMIDLPFLVLFMTSVGIQLMIYCYGGQHLQNESKNVANFISQTINSAAWPIDLRKVLLFSMLRAQRPFKLTGIFFDVDLRLFLWVWRTAGSYVTLLRSVDQQAS